MLLENFLSSYLSHVCSIFDLRVVNLGGLGLVAYLVWRRLRASERRGVRCTPPGPPTKPIIGNLLDMPKRKQWITYHQWAQQYGDIVLVRALGQKIVILDSLEAVNDLMDRRSATYSNRPSTNITKLFGLDTMLGSLPYGETWRSARRLLHQDIHIGAISRYNDTAIRRGRLFAQLMGTDSRSLDRRVRESLAGTIMKLFYAIDITGEDDRYVQVAEKVMDFVNRSTLPGFYLVDVLGMLKYLPSWFPGAAFQREAIECRKVIQQAVWYPLAHVKNNMVAGAAPPSIAKEMLAGMDDPGDHVKEEMIAFLAGTGYMAGMDTTVGSIRAFFFALLLNPEVQARAQAELEVVVGSDRLPTFEDRPQLPYVEAVISEVLRWLPVAPLGLPHMNTMDDEYRGYFIPKGSLIIGNIWAILQDPEAYPEPDKFKPERFLTTNEDGYVEYDKTVRDPRVACFGFGRRFCPGKWLADQSLYASISTCLATLTVSPVKDESGNPKVPELDVTDGLLSYVKPFECDVKFRSRGTEELLVNTLLEPSMAQ